MNRLIFAVAILAACRAWQAPLEPWPPIAPPAGEPRLRSSIEHLYFGANTAFSESTDIEIPREISHLTFKLVDQGSSSPSYWWPTTRALRPEVGELKSGAFLKLVEAYNSAQVDLPATAHLQFERVVLNGRGLLRAKRLMGADGQWQAVEDHPLSATLEARDLQMDSDDMAAGERATCEVLLTAVLRRARDVYARRTGRWYFQSIVVPDEFEAIRCQIRGAASGREHLATIFEQATAATKRRWTYKEVAHVAGEEYRCHNSDYETIDNAHGGCNMFDFFVNSKDSQASEYKPSSYFDRFEKKPAPEQPVPPSPK